MGRAFRAHKKLLLKDRIKQAVRRAEELGTDLHSMCLKYNRRDVPLNEMLPRLDSLGRRALEKILGMMTIWISSSETGRQDQIRQLGALAALRGINEIQLFLIAQQNFYKEGTPTPAFQQLYYPNEFAWSFLDALDRRQIAALQQIITARVIPYSVH
jgi:hypothetical protein